jgi:hypothetical protein
MIEALAGVALAFLATARVTRFVTRDLLAQPIRTWFANRFGPDSRLAYLVTCGWCASIWIGILPTLGWVTWWAGVPWHASAALWLGISWVYGILDTNLDVEEE